MTKKVMIIEQTEVDDLRNNLQALTDTVEGLQKEIGRKNSRAYARHTLLTLSEACEFLRISRATAFRWINNGTLSPVKAGRKNLFSQAALESVLIRVNTNNVRGYDYK